MFNWKFCQRDIQLKHFENVLTCQLDVDLVSTLIGQCAVFVSIPMFYGISELLCSYSNIFEVCSISKIFQTIIPLSNDFNMLPLTSCRVTSIGARHKAFPKLRTTFSNQIKDKTNKFHIWGKAKSVVSTNRIYRHDVVIIYDRT